MNVGYETWQDRRVSTMEGFDVGRADKRVKTVAAIVKEMVLKECIVIYFRREIDENRSE